MTIEILLDSNHFSLLFYDTLIKNNLIPLLIIIYNFQFLNLKKIDIVFNTLFYNWLFTS